MALHASIFQLIYFLVEWFILQTIRMLQGGASPRTEESVEGKLFVITGANSGLGKYASQEIAKRGATVVMACRNMIEGKKAMDEIKRNSGSANVDLVCLDLSDLSSIRKCAETIKSKYQIIDVLINNAGISLNCPERKFTKDGFEMHMGTNHLGHFLFTNLLLDNIKKATNGRIITVSSTVAVYSNLDINNLMMDNCGLGIGNTMGYANSKFANSLFNKELAKRLKGTRVTTYSLCPGLARTNILQHYTGPAKIMTGLGKYLFFLPIDTAGDILLFCSLAKELSSSSGEMYRFGRKFSSIEPLLKDNLAVELWEKSDSLVGGI